MNYSDVFYFGDVLFFFFNSRKCWVLNAHLRFANIWHLTDYKITCPAQAQEEYEPPEPVRKGGMLSYPKAGLQSGSTLSSWCSVTEQY